MKMRCESVEVGDRVKFGSGKKTWVVIDTWRGMTMDEDNRPHSTAFASLQVEGGKATHAAQVATLYPA